MPHPLKEGYIVSPEIDRQIGIFGNVRAVEPLKSGMSGGEVLKVSTDVAHLVIKRNFEQPHLVQREIEAYDDLKRTLIAKVLTLPLHSFPDEAVVAMPFFDGVQVREGLQRGIVPRETGIRVLKEIINLKKDWWSSQEKKRSAERVISMQREEWPETKYLVNDSVNKIAAEFGISSESIIARPFKVNGVQHQPLKATVDETENFLEADPPYTVKVHGDASGANTLVNLKSGIWRLTDTQWGGNGDCAEAAIRFIKQKSTATAQKALVTDVSFDGKNVEFTLEAAYHPLTEEMHQIGVQSLEAFQQVMGDATFTGRAEKYFTGSYIRELALAPRRSKPGHWVLTLHNSSRRQLVHAAN